MINRQITIAKLLLKEAKSRLDCFYYKYEPAGEKQKEFHLSGKKIRILQGAPRSSKTTTSIYDVTAISLCQHPKYDYGPGNIGWVILPKFHKVYEKGGMIDKFKGVVPPNMVKQWIIDKNDNIYELHYNNGSCVVFKSQEQGIDSFTSNKVHWILVDERMDDPDIRLQLRARIIDESGILIYTMDSIEDDEWVDELKTLPYAQVWKITMRDNKFLPKSEVEMLDKELTGADREKIFEGNYANKDIEFLFPKELFNEKNYSPKVPRRFDIIDGEFVPSDLGDLRVYREPEETQYVMSWDVSEGVGGNAHAVHVFDEYGEQVAVYLNNTLNYANLADKILIPLGQHYKMALGVGELRSFGYTVLDNMIKKGYPNLYVDVENKRIKQIKKQDRMRFGVVTDEVNKPVMVAQTWDDLKTGKLLLHDEYTYIQLLHFVKDIKGKNKTKQGIKYHGTRAKGIADLKNSDDDLVMSLLFADRALNAWDYLKPRVKEVKVTIDEADVRNRVIYRYAETTDDWY